MKLINDKVDDRIQKSMFNCRVLAGCSFKKLYDVFLKSWYNCELHEYITNKIWLQRSLQTFLPNIIQCSTKLNSVWFPRCGCKDVLLPAWPRHINNQGISEHFFTFPVQMWQTATNKQLARFALMWQKSEHKKRECRIPNSKRAIFCHGSSGAPSQTS